jgi:hypothetical protein
VVAVNDKEIEQVRRCLDEAFDYAAEALATAEWEKAERAIDDIWRSQGWVLREIAAHIAGAPVVDREGGHP